MVMSSSISHRHTAPSFIPMSGGNTGNDYCMCKDWWDQSGIGSLRHRGSVARPPGCSEGDGGKVFNQRELEYIADFAIWHDLFVFLCASVLRKRVASWRRHAGGWES